ncbi:helix-turn-helix domain-containing protein [Planctobacterium marinum]|uniref:HTH araC/xylS-type domain-containing protein n=1 Tax=Planctobacterium marinum TaxID=1631968 RepID=A0AA48HSS6_9ALTE|nr:hypothetical protein MACH26_35730 [Planctobacterium marinum]
MVAFSFVNLIQSATLSVCVLGAFLLWRHLSFRGIALLLVLIALSSVINTLEETGITRDIYLVSPVFIMLFGPASYLATRHLIGDKLRLEESLHFLPVLPVLFFTTHVQVIIAIGTFWRLIYALLTARVLLDYKGKLDEQRSDADEFSFIWLLWVVVVTTVFNLIDLVRLNIQQWLSPDLNALGQAVNNGLWLVVIMLTVVKLSEQKKPPQSKSQDRQDSTASSEQAEDYLGIYEELQSLLTQQQWYLQARLTLAELSQLSGLQTRDISRAINLLAGKSFNEYINQFRIEEVCRQLDSGDTRPVLQIAIDSGFSSKAAFNKVFKEQTGQTPSQYKADINGTKTRE